MANPQPDKFTKLSNELFEAIMTTDFSKRQRNILDLIIRMSYGCGKKTALLRNSDFEQSGVGRNKIKSELEHLEQSKVIFRDGEIIQINKNYDQWRVNIIKSFDQAKFNQILKRNLSVPKTGTLIPETGTDENEEFPKREPDSSQNGNPVVPKTGTDTALQTSNDAGYSDPKDILKTIKDINNNNDEFWNNIDNAGLTPEQELENEIESYYQAKRGKNNWPLEKMNQGWIKKAIEEGFTRDEMIEGINLSFLRASSVNSFEYCLKTMRTQREKRENWNAMKQQKKANPSPERQLPESMKNVHQHKTLEEMTPEEKAAHEEKVKLLQEKIKRLKEMQADKKREVSP